MVRKGLLGVWFLAVGLALGGVGFAQAEPITALRTLSSASISPGETLTVTVQLSFSQDATGVSLLENFPDGFEFLSVTAAAQATVFTDRAEAKLIFFWGLGTFQAGSTAQVSYQVRAPDSEGTFTFSGQLLSAGPALELQVGGTQTVAVSSGGGTPPPNQPPLAAFSFAPNGPQVGQAVQFTDQSSDPDGAGDLAEWSWDFGDGTLSNQRSPQHAFVAAGAFTVRLTVKDRAGSTSSASQVVTVVEAPPAGGQSVSQVIASLVPNDPAGSANADLIVGDQEILRAIEFWISGQPVPGADGGVVDDALILELIRLWVTSQPLSS